MTKIENVSVTKVEQNKTIGMETVAKKKIKGDCTMLRRKLIVWWQRSPAADLGTLMAQEGCSRVKT